MAHNLNLLANYEKSLADINRELAERMKKEAVVVKKKSNKALIVALLALLTMVGVFAYLFFYYFINISGQSIESEFDALNENMQSTEETLGYVSVQIFEFADETDTLADNKTLIAPIKDVAPEKVAQEIKRDNAYTDKKEMLKTINGSEVQDAKPEPKKEPVVAAKPVPKPTPKPAPAVKPVPAKPAEKQYYLLFENINSEEYNRIKKINLNFNLTDNIIDVSGDVSVMWRVYEITPDGDITLSGNKVKYVSEFTDKNEAVDYAKQNDIQSVIRAEDVDNRIYTIKLSQTTIEKAKEFAVSTDIKDKVIKIVRTK